MDTILKPFKSLWINQEVEKCDVKCKVCGGSRSKVNSRNAREIKECCFHCSGTGKEPTFFKKMFSWVME